MEAGKLRHRVKFQEFALTQNPNTGAVSQTWSDVVTLWASVEPLSVREFIQSASTQNQITARITTRYHPSLSSGMRALHRGKIYNIQGVLTDKETGLEYLTMPCSEGVNDGGG